MRMGIKMFECRKAWPKIPLFTGRVYVVIKGTTQVAGYFTLCNVIKTNALGQAWHDYGKRLAIEYDWYCQYAASAREYLYFWELDGVYKYDGVRDLEEYFGVKHNPQSFIYTDKEPYIPGTWERVNNPELRKMVRPNRNLKPMCLDDSEF